MSLFAQAIDSGTQLIIHGTTVIGTGRVSSSDGITASVRVQPELFDTIFRDDPVYQGWLKANFDDERARRYSTFQFDMWTGEERGSMFIDCERPVYGIRCVSEMQFRYGLCPKAYADVEGYASETQYEGDEE
jgi:hypothetical protein